jgi:phthalate 4,5-cis-dihydrodiol dehydrogenase
MDTQKQLGVGVVGLGLAGSSMIQAIKSHPSIRIVAAADRRPELRDRITADFEVPTYDDLEAMCRRNDVNVVYVATPHEFHREHAVLAAENKKHVVVEKPMALSLADCDEMVAAADRNGVVLIIGHTHGFDPTVALMRRTIAGGDVGRLAMINMWNYNDFIYRPRRPEELDTALGGGILFNQLPHQVEIARLLAASPVRSVRAMAAILDRARPTEGCCMVFIEFESGVAASLTYSGYDHFDSDEFHFWVAESGQKKAPAYGRSRRFIRENTTAGSEAKAKADRYGYGSTFWKARQAEAGERRQPHFGIVIATCERADLRQSADGVLIYGDEGVREITPPPQKSAPGQGDVLDELCGAVLKGEKPVHDGRWGRDTMEACLAILKSYKERREIRIGQD